MDNTSLIGLLLFTITFLILNADFIASSLFTGCIHRGHLKNRTFTRDEFSALVDFWHHSITEGNYAAFCMEGTAVVDGEKITSHCPKVFTPVDLPDEPSPPTTAPTAAPIDYGFDFFGEYYEEPEEESSMLLDLRPKSSKGVKTVVFAHMIEDFNPEVIYVLCDDNYRCMDHPIVTMHADRIEIVTEDTVGTAGAPSVVVGGNFQADLLYLSGMAYSSEYFTRDDYREPVEARLRLASTNVFSFESHLKRIMDSISGEPYYVNYGWDYQLDNVIDGYGQHNILDVPMELSPQKGVNGALFFVYADSRYFCNTTDILCHQEELTKVVDYLDENPNSVIVSIEEFIYHRDTFMPRVFAELELIGFDISGEHKHAVWFDMDFDIELDFLADWEHANFKESIPDDPLIKTATQKINSKLLKDL